MRTSGAPAQRTWRRSLASWRPWNALYAHPVFAAERLAPLTARLIRLVDGLPGVQFVGSRDQRLVNTVSFVVPGSDSITLLAGLDLEGICASSGSACSAGSLEPSHVVKALGLGHGAGEFADPLLARPGINRWQKLSTSSASCRRSFAAHVADERRSCYELTCTSLACPTTL